MEAQKRNSGNIFEVDEVDQYRTVDELLEQSRANSIYYTLLILSTLIVTAGLLLNNSPIVIGGMLVTPVLTPLLVIALGLSVGEMKPIKREAVLIVKSFAFIVFFSLLMGFALGSSEAPLIFENSIRTAILYFITAVASGAAATFAWARKEMAVTLPGVAIAVSLVPPLSLIGIGLSIFSLAVVRFYFFILIFNLFGILAGSLTVFSLLKFYRAGAEVKEKTAEIEIREEQDKKANHEEVDTSRGGN